MAYFEPRIYRAVNAGPLRFDIVKFCCNNNYYFKKQKQNNTQITREHSHPDNQQSTSVGNCSRTTCPFTPASHAMQVNQKLLRLHSTILMHNKDDFDQNV